MMRQTSSRSLVRGGVAALLVCLAGGAAAAQTAPAPTPVLVSGRTPAAAAPAAETADQASLETERASAWYLKGRFLIGVTGGVVATVDSDLGTQYRLSPFFRWNSRREGWGPLFGFSGYEADLRVPVGNGVTTVGSVKVRPVMAGVGYAIVKGRTRTTIGLVGGYAFNAAKANRELPDGVAVTVDINNAWVVQPKADVTFAVARRFALTASMGYVISNPSVSVTVTQINRPTYQSTDHVRADGLALRIGAAVSLF